MKGNVIITKLKVFMRLTMKVKLLVFEAFVLSAVVRAMVLVIPFNKLKRVFGKHKNTSSFEIDHNQYEMIKNVSWAVVTITKYTPWESKCLVQAITAQYMLKRRGVHSTLYLGVSKEGASALKAHAWLRAGKAYVTGGGNKEDFTEVARFSNKK